jgi:uncharacterized protein (DUF433 family)
VFGFAHVISIVRCECTEVIIAYPIFLAFIKVRQYCSFMIDWPSCPTVERHPEKVSGSWVLRNIRVPVVALFENLEAVSSIDDFLSWFPGATKEQVKAVFEFLKADLQAT